MKAAGTRMPISPKEEASLRQSPLFRELPEEEWQSVLSSTRAKAYRSGETVYAPSSYARSLGYVLSGEVTAGREDGTLLNTIRAGAYFGAAAIFGNGASAYVSVITAHKACRVALIPGRTIEHLVRSDPGFAIRYIRFLTDRIRYLNRKIDGFTAGSAEEKLLTYLRQNQDSEGRVSTAGGIARLSRTLSVSRASLYRAMDRLTLSGVIRRDGSDLTLLQGGKEVST